MKSSKASSASSSSEYSNFPDNTHLEINETFQEMIGHVNIQTTICYVSLAKEQLHKDVQDHAL